MGKIVLLDELTINQIAAGEVIERPASVIKEMVENSIDAGAKNIVVEIKKGGIELIKITDDGSGIAEDDMEIAFERHATSKIRSSKDLAHVKSMGFRGEALASIAAISKIEMVSKTDKDNIGHKIVVEGGEVKEKTEIGCQKGTTITVENLFYNTPVRYKFLKKDYTEAGYIEDAITRIALVNKDVSFKLINSGKTILQTNGNNDAKSLIYSLYGKDFSNAIEEVDYTYEDMRVTGVIGHPSIARATRAYQMFFVNGRFIKDKTLTSATEQAFKGCLPQGKFGVVILNIEMDPQKVDVNVHPAKLEVRFQDESQIFKAIYHTIKSVEMPSVDSENIKPLTTDDSFIIKSPEPKEVFGTIPEKKEIELKEEIKEDKVEVKEPEKEVSNNDIKEEIDDEEKYQKIETETNFVQPKIRTGFSDLIKKVMGDSKDDREEYRENNLVESIFEERNGSKKATPKLDSEELENKIQESKTVEESDDDNKTLSVEDKNDAYSQIAKKQENNFELESKENLGEEGTINGKAIMFGNVAISSDSIETIKKVESNDENAPEVSDENNEEISDSDNTFAEKVESIIKENNPFTESDLIEEKASEEETVETSEMQPDDEEKTDEKLVDDSDLNVGSTINSIKEQDIQINKIASSIIKDKINGGFEATQAIDTTEIMENLKNTTTNNEENSDDKNKEEITPEFAEMYKRTFGRDVISNKDKDGKITAYNEFLDVTDNVNENVFDNEDTYVPVRKYKYVGMAFDTYLIVEINDDMYLIDKYSASEKILYENLKENYYSNKEKDSQNLLLPDIVTLNKKQIILAHENQEMLESAGFGFEEFGDNTIKLFAVPTCVEKLNTKQLFIDILNELESVSIINKTEKEDRFLSTIAKKSIGKCKLELNDAEITDLLNSFLRLKSPFLYQDGRTTALRMSKIDFERKFNRR